MERISSALEDCPRPNRSDVCLHSNAASSVPPPQVIVPTTPRAPELSRNNVKPPREPVRFDISNLPIEIILLVAEYLSPSNIMSLTYTCAKLRKEMGISIGRVLGKKKGIVQLPNSALEDNLPTLTFSRGEATWTLPTILSNEQQTERLDLLTMLDRDQKIPQSRAVCSSCADTHDRSRFSAESLAQSSRERRCIGSAGCVWLCPHWIFDYNLMTTSTAPKGRHSCGNKGVSLALLDRSSFKMDGDGLQPYAMWPLVPLRGSNNRPSKELVADILRRMNLSMCKHLRSPDAFVSRLYSPDCLLLQGSAGAPKCECQTCAWRLANPKHTKSTCTGGMCESCQTWVFFLFLQHNGEETLSMFVQRETRRLEACTDRAWLEKVNDPAEFERLEREWNAASNEA